MKLEELLAELKRLKTGQGSSAKFCHIEPYVFLLNGCDDLARRLLVAVDELKNWCPSPAKSYRACECRVCQALRKIKEPE